LLRSPRLRRTRSVTPRDDGMPGTITDSYRSEVVVDRRF
jgi:hypothetical protein